MESNSISENFPLLNRLEKVLLNEYINMSDDEIMALNKEIQTVDETNCSYMKYNIAKSLESQVSGYCSRYLE